MCLSHSLVSFKHHYDSALHPATSAQTDTSGNTPYFLALVFKSKFAFNEVIIQAE